MRRLFTLVMFFILSVSIFPQHTIRVMTWNIHNYTYYNPPTQFDYDNPALKYVIEMINPDILVCQEVLSQESVDQLLNYVLSPEYKAAVFIDGYDTDNALFYKESKLTSLGNIQLITTLRDINEFRLVHKLTNDTLIVFSLHLKSNVGSGDNQARRYSEATVLRNVTSKLPLNSNYLVAGDFNILNSSELAFNVLINTSSPGYVIDPQQATGNWESNASFAHTHTWSSSNLTVRFDMILFSQALKDKGGIDYVENSYSIAGNDGLHFNLPINSGTNNSASRALLDSLISASDHLPVYADFTFGVPTSVSSTQYIPASFELKQNYPNPFNPETVISYKLSASSNVQLKVYDLLGKEIATLVNEFKPAGTYNSQFSIIKYQLPSGVYFYQLKADNFIQTKKMVLLK